MTSVPRHVVLTRSAYGPDTDPETNRRRLDLTRAVTARLMARQTATAWTWVVLLHPADPLLEERMALYRSSAPAFEPIPWEPGELHKVPWDPYPDREVDDGELVAATAYGAPWRASWPADRPLLQTRLDDDDGLHPGTLLAYQQRARRLRTRTVLTFPYGYRVHGKRLELLRWRRNAMHSLYTPAHDSLCIYDYGHTRCNQVATVKTTDVTPGWLWIRHRDTISGQRGTDSPVPPHVRKAFPINWSVVGRAAA